MDRGQAQHAVLFIAMFPTRDSRRGGSQLLFDVAIASAFVQQQHDSHPLRHTRR